MKDKQTFDIGCGGYSVQADYYEGAGTHKIMLFLIGWTSNKGRYGPMIDALAGATGSSALVFDYSGHGDSPIDIGMTRPAQHFLEVIHVFDWIAEQHPDAELTVVGTSYGGFMATQLTKYRSFKNLVLRVPAIYRPGDFYTVSPVWATTQTTTDFRTNTDAIASHPLLMRASAFAGNTLVIVHDRDELVPPETTNAYIRAFNADTFTAKTAHSPAGESTEWFAVYHARISDWILAQK